MYVYACMHGCKQISEDAENMNAVWIHLFFEYTCICVCEYMFDKEKRKTYAIGADETKISLFSTCS